MSGPLVLAPSLADDLRALDVRAGDVLEVHRFMLDTVTERAETVTPRPLSEEVLA